MDEQLKSNLSLAQRNRLAEWDINRSVDVHCHCLPGLDDGPDTMVTAVELCKRIVDDGVTTVIASPHQLGRYDGVNTTRRVMEALESLKSELASDNIPLELFAGADVRIDERILSLIDKGEVLPAGPQRNHLLLELPHRTFVEPLPTIQLLRDRGIQTIMTHPERHHFLVGSLRRLKSWVAAGAALQITAGSFLGDFGRQAAHEAWRLAESGMISLVASDAHDAANRPPRLSAATAAIAARFGRDFARQVCLVNPLQVINGQTLTPCSPKA